MAELVAERVAELEQSLESIIEAFEQVDAPPKQLEDDIPALYRLLQVRLAQGARLVRGRCHCSRFELTACLCAAGTVQ
jgi:hypothetical protein